MLSPRSVHACSPRPASAAGRCGRRSPSDTAFQHRVLGDSGSSGHAFSRILPRVPHRRSSWDRTSLEPLRRAPSCRNASAVVWGFGACVVHREPPERAPSTAPNSFQFLPEAAGAKLLRVQLSAFVEVHRHFHQAGGLWPASAGFACDTGFDSCNGNRDERKADEALSHIRK